MDSEISPITFEQICEVWSAELWPRRVSAIETVSCVGADGLIDMNVLNFRSQVIFFGVRNGENLVAVASCHQTAALQFRFRGLYVNEMNRGRGLAARLIHFAENWARERGGKEIWALCRTHNGGLFEKLGFSQKLKTEKYEFGPHYVMVKKI